MAQTLSGGWERRGWCLSCVSAWAAVRRDGEGSCAAEGPLLPCWQREGLPARFLSRAAGSSSLLFSPGVCNPFSDVSGVDVCSCTKHGAHPSTYGGEQWLGMVVVPARAVTLRAPCPSPQKSVAAGSMWCSLPSQHWPWGLCRSPAQRGEVVLQEVTTLWELARCSGLECDG